MRRVADGLELTREERIRLHREGYAWAVELGRWGDVAIAALDARLASQRDGVAALLASPCDRDSEARWKRLSRAGRSSEAAIAMAKDTIRLHANRLGVFAEAEAILHYFLFRLDIDGREA